MFFAWLQAVTKADDSPLACRFMLFAILALLKSSIGGGIRLVVPGIVDPRRGDIIFLSGSFLGFRSVSNAISNAMLRPQQG